MGRQAKRRRQEKEVVTGTPNWLELPLDLLRCVFERLSFTSLNRAKLVCSSWYFISRSYVPQNQIPWLILFPHKEAKRGSCVLFNPENRRKVYRFIDFGAEYAQSNCLTTCGSWLLWLSDVNNLYILNPFTWERIDLPETKYYFQSEVLEIRCDRTCFWIDNKTKDYLIVLVRSNSRNLFIKKGYTSWQNICFKRSCEDVFYNDKMQKLFVHYTNNTNLVHIWDMSGDTPHRDRIVSLPCFHFNLTDFHSFLDEKNRTSLSFKSRIAVTVSRDFLMVSYVVHHLEKTWCFRIYKINMANKKWVQIDSLGDEALIYGMGITVVANGSIPGIKRNSIYFGSRDSEDPTNVFVYDLTTQKVEPLPQCVLPSIPYFSEARWFFPC